MAKSAAVKTIRKAPALKAAPEQTYQTLNRAIIVFNNACNVEILVNTDSMTASVTVTDNVEEKNYAGTATLEEV